MAIISAAPCKSGGIGTDGKGAFRLGYSPFGQVFLKHSDYNHWSPADGSASALEQLGNLMPYQYTGRYTEATTGLVHLDARWYNPQTQRFVQPDLWNFRNTGLPMEVRHELMRFAGLDAAQLLRDPGQQMGYGYVSGNPLVWLDPLGLAKYICNVGDFSIDIPEADSYDSSDLAYATAGMPSALLAVAVNNVQDTINDANSSSDLEGVYSGHLTGVLIQDQYLVMANFYNQVMQPAQQLPVQEGSEIYYGTILGGVIKFFKGNGDDVLPEVVPSAAQNLLDALTEVPDIFKAFCDSIESK